MGGDGRAAQAAATSHWSQASQQFPPASQQGFFDGRQVSRITAPEPPLPADALRTTSPAAGARGQSRCIGLRAVTQPELSLRDLRYPARALVNKAAPQKPPCINWRLLYADLKVRYEQARMTGDTYAVCAFDAAIHGVDGMVMDAYRFFGATNSAPSACEPVAAYNALCRMGIKTPAFLVMAGWASTPLKALKRIDEFTREAQLKLAVRSRQFAAVPRAETNNDQAVRCDREGLDCWLGHEEALAQAIAERAFCRSDYADAAAARKQQNYYMKLRVRYADHGDPWDVSRTMIRHSARRGESAKTRQLQAAHGQLLRAMADWALQSTARCIGAPVGPVDGSGSLAPAPPSAAMLPGVLLNPKVPASRGTGLEMPSGFKRPTAYNWLKLRCARAAASDDAATARLYKNAFEAIEELVLIKYRNCFPQQSTEGEIAPEEAYRVLDEAWHARGLPATTIGIEAIDEAMVSINDDIASINRFTFERQCDLRIRDTESPASSKPSGPAIPGFGQAPTTAGQHILRQLMKGQPLSSAQAKELTYRANLAESLGRLGSSGQIMRNLPGYLTRLANAAESLHGGASRARIALLLEFGRMLTELRRAGCL